MRIGIYDPYLDILGGGERYVMTLAEHLSKKNQVEVFWEDESVKKGLELRFSLGLGKVKFVDNIFVRRKSLLEKAIKSRSYNLIFYLSDGSIPSSLARKNILHFQTPFTHINGRTSVNRLKFARFQHIVCNSNFTKKFIDRTYGVDSLVIYPPVDTENFSPSKKENLILTVGRFISFFECKKQEIMIKAFRKMIDSGLRNCQLVIVGGLLMRDKDYFLKLKKQADKYPIELLQNISFKKLKDYYSRAAIYWHATGFGESEEKNPELFEHFGISTVEAMVSGCVPVVFNGGGQREIIDHGLNGFLWQTEKELIDYTVQLIKNKRLREKMATAAIKKSQNFSKEIFLRRFDEIIK